MAVNDQDLSVLDPVAGSELAAIEDQQPAQWMIVFRFAEAQHGLRPHARCRGPRQAVQDDAFELLLNPGCHGLFPARVRVRKGNSAPGVDGNGAVEGSAVEIAADGGAEARKVLPRRPRRQGFLKQGNCGGVGVLTLERPGEGKRGEIADLLILLAIELARFLARAARIDRVVARGGRRPRRLTFAIRGQRQVLQFAVNGHKLGLRHRLTVTQSHQAHSLSVDRCHDLEGQLAVRAPLVELVGVAGDCLGKVPEQERCLAGTGQHAVAALAGHHQAARVW